MHILIYLTMFILSEKNEHTTIDKAQADFTRLYANLSDQIDFNKYQNYQKMTFVNNFFGTIRIFLLDF
jgi:hypothetical protein